MRQLWLVCWLALAAYGATPVWIDTDPSVASGEHEIDDGFALWQAFRSPELSVRGVSVVFGNAPLSEAAPIAERLLREFGSPALQAHRGAASAAEIGRETDATRALAAALQKEKLTLLVLGPATNIASLVQLHPELINRIDRVIAVAGRRPGQHFITGQAKRPFRDFNFEMDSEAFAVLLRAKVPMVLAPWEISSKVWLTKEDLDRLQLPRWMRAAADDWLAMWKREFGVDGFNPFDTLAVAYATSPSLLRCESLPVEIRQEADDVKPGGVKPYLVVATELATPRRVLYCDQAKPEFKADLLRRLTQGLDHSAWDALLHKYVNPASRVDYRAWKVEANNALSIYIDQLAAPWPLSLSPAEQKAALINAYNALTVRWMLDHYPTESIWRTRRPFTEPRHKLDGKSVSLDDIETRLRNLGDPRVHAVLVCASISCPPLRREAYLASRLDEQMDDNARVWLADASKNEFVPERRLARVSMIFKWYKQDFNKSGQSVAAFLARFAPPAKRDFLRADGLHLEYQTYRWGLNDVSPIGEMYSELQFYKDTLKSKL